MIRLVGIQRSEDAQQEFLLLQNQGSMRQLLRGHGILSENAIDCGALSAAWYQFPDDVFIPSGAFVMLRTGRGDGRWSRTKDGALIYLCFMNRDSSIWNETQDPLHVTHIQHTYKDCKETVLLR